MKILADRRGAVAAVSAVVMVAVLGIAGLAIDATRLWMVNARLKTAIDAAALVAARQISLAAVDRDAQAQAIYWANFTQSGRTPNYLGSTLHNATIAEIPAAEPGMPVSRIQVNGRATVPTTLFSIINRSDTDVVDAAVAERQGKGLELALVLDVTGSMASNNNISHLRTAARDLVNILYSGQERQPDLWVSVVPYTATVNIGSGRTDWLQPGTLNENSFLPSVWRGCVQARAGTITTNGIATLYPSGGDESEDSPSTLRFHPHFWPSNRDRYSFNVAEGQTGRQLLTNAAGQPINRGDNAWVPGAGGVVATNNGGANAAVWEMDPENPGTDAQDNTRGNNARGPNVGCGRAVLPLTRNRTPILDQINALRATHRGGTMANLGLQIGLGTLSPGWRADWNLAETRDGEQLPLRYGARHMDKAIVLMTDGENRWHDEEQNLPGRNCRADGNSPPCSVTNLAVLNSLDEGAFTVSGTERQGNRVINNNSGADRTAYGRLHENRLGLGTVNNTNATTEIDARMSRLCEAIKDRGIIVYTVVFDPNDNLPQATRNLYSGCATSASHAFRSRDGAGLALNFRTIAGQLAKLRLAQ